MVRTTIVVYLKNTLRQNKDFNLRPNRHSHQRFGAKTLKRAFLLVTKQEGGGIFYNIKYQV